MAQHQDSAGQWLKDYATALKHGSIKPYSLTERKARAATRNQPWGPTGTELSVLAEMTYNPQDCSIILAIVELRLGYPPKKWRNVYKALTLIEYLVRQGSDTCVRQARGSLLAQLEALAAGFNHVGADGRDMGTNVRHRAQAILALLKDEPRLAAEREAHQKKRGAYQGFSSYDVAAQGGQHGDGGSGGTNGWQATPQDGGHLASQAQGGQPGSPDYRERDPSDSLRQAGETKGVSMEENQRYLAALKRLLDLPANRVCADCAGSDTGARPTWASINCGVFICMRCAGVHRGMGVHVSKVRSCSLDTWLPEQVEFMARTGNALGNAYWEAAMPAGQKQRQCTTLTDLDAFCRRKYVNKEFAAGVWPPQQLANSPEALRILADCLPADRARELQAQQEAASGAAAAAAAAAAAEAEAARAAAEQQGAAAAAASASAVNLMDFDPEPVAVDHSNHGLALAAIDPMKSLEEVFSASSLAAAEPQGNGFAPSQPAATLGSWDMGATMQAWQAASEAAEAAASASQASSSASARQPARPAYCPPWAPQPAHGSAANNMQLVPAAAAFDQGFHSMPAMQTYSSDGSLGYSQQGSFNSYSQHRLHRQDSLQSINSSTGLLGGGAQQQQPRPAATPKPPRPAPRPPATPAEAKAQELLATQLGAFNLHADTVSALKPSPRLAAQQQQQAAVLPLAAMRTPR